MTQHFRIEAIAVRAASRAPMSELGEARVTPESGVEGDFRGRPGPRQVTLLSAEAWQSACEQLGAELPWHTRRANLLVRGADLEDTAGARVRIGDVELEVTGETDPCQRMDEQHAGLRRALEPAWRGGVTCRVLSGGAIRVGDAGTLAPGPGGAG